MKDYWLVIDWERKTVEICFPDRENYTINACLATISREQQEQMLLRLQEITKDSPSFTLSYEYFTMEVNPWCIMCDFHMFDESIRFMLFTDVFTKALEEYLTEMEKLRLGAKKGASHGTME